MQTAAENLRHQGISGQGMNPSKGVAYGLASMNAEVGPTRVPVSGLGG